MKTTVFFQGIGLVTPLGCGHNHVWNELISGKCGVRVLESQDYAEIPSKVAALVPKGWCYKNNNIKVLYEIKACNIV